MIIGKAGNYIKQIKETSGSYVQISQKAKDVSLQERCITVIGKSLLLLYFKFMFIKKTNVVIIKATLLVLIFFLMLIDKDMMILKGFF